MLSQHSFSMWLAGLIARTALVTWIPQVKFVKGRKGKLPVLFKVSFRTGQYPCDHVALVKLVTEPARIPEEGKLIQPLNAGSDRICSHP